MTAPQEDSISDLLTQFDNDKHNTELLQKKSCK